MSSWVDLEDFQRFCFGNICVIVNLKEFSTDHREIVYSYLYLRSVSTNFTYNPPRDPFHVQGRIIFVCVKILDSKLNFGPFFAPCVIFLIWLYRKVVR